MREAIGDEAAERIAVMKKQEMAEAAERLLVGTGWLPPLLRTERPAWLDAPQAEADADAVAEAPEVVELDAADVAEPEAVDLGAVEDGNAVEESESFNVAAE